MIQTFMKQAGETACLAIDYLMAAYCIGENPPLYCEAATVTALLGAYTTETGIDREFFVKDPVKLMELMDMKHKYSVTKKDITSFKDLPLEGFAAVRFDYNGHSHWVLAQNQEVFYDSLDNSVCRSKGKPTTARIIAYEDK